MELNTYIAHGASRFVNQMYCGNSDMTIVLACLECGHYNDRFGHFTDNDVPRSTKHNNKCMRCQRRMLVYVRLPYGAIRMQYQQLTAGADPTAMYSTRLPEMTSTKCKRSEATKIAIKDIL